MRFQSSSKLLNDLAIFAREGNGHVVFPQISASRTGLPNSLIFTPNASRLPIASRGRLTAPQPPRRRLHHAGFRRALRRVGNHRPGRQTVVVTTLAPPPLCRMLKELQTRVVIGPRPLLGRVPSQPQLGKAAVAGQLSHIRTARDTARTLLQETRCFRTGAVSPRGWASSCAKPHRQDVPTIKLSKHVDCVAFSVEPRRLVNIRARSISGGS